MLRVLKKEEFEKYIDFTYALAMDLSKSVYPTYADGIKTKEDFMERSRKAFERENEEILLFEINEEVQGWIHYYVLKEDNYISFCSFNINNYAELAVDEFLEYISRKRKGDILYFGLPTENASVMQYLTELDFIKEDEEYVDVLFFSRYEMLEEKSLIVKVSKDNYSEFEKIHRIHDEDMYWNNERLYNDLDNWNIYLFYEGAEVSGAIYYCFTDNSMMEIFGVDYASGCFNYKVFMQLMIKALNEGKKAGMKHLVFFHDEKEHEIVMKLGFRHVSKYVLYTREV